MGPVYDEFISHGAVTPPAIASMAGLLGNGPGRCLDLGCGTGIAFATLAGLGWDVVGADVSADQLRIAATKDTVSGVKLVKADAAALPFEDESFDAVVSLLTHTDFDDWVSSVAEVSRVLRSEGRFIYVGVHPCFVGPMIDRPEGTPPRMHAGYRRDGRRPAPKGPVRSRVGVSHLPLAQLLGAVLETSMVLQAVEEPGEDDDYPMLFALRAIKPPHVT
jgi:SAM-dependent methyltransferase